MEQVDWKDFFAQAAVEGVGPTVGKYLNYYRMMFGANECKGGLGSAFGSVGGLVGLTLGVKVRFRITGLGG